MSTEQDEPDLPLGTMLGRYRVDRLLGAGGMGAVYLATHTGLNKAVVLKVLHPHYAKSPEVRQRFVREGEAAARIRHAHVVDVTDVGVEGATPYLVMEYLHGESLGALLDRQGALAPDRAVDLMIPVLAAVDAAHAAGVVHRDLKPDNLFIARTATGDPLPKVLDFGISRVVSDDAARQTGTAAMLGTPAYMAPEQIERARDADARTDQYSLGVILYECVTGHRAFDGDNMYAILKLVGEGRFRLPRTLRPELSPDLEAIVLRAMAHDPAERFESLRGLACVLMPHASERVRMLWGTQFRPSGEYDAAYTRLEISRPPPSTMSPDTLIEAVGERDTTIPLGASVRRRRTVWVAAALVVPLLAAGAFLAAGRRTHAVPSPTPITHAAMAPIVRAGAPIAASIPPPAPMAAPSATGPDASAVSAPAVARVAPRRIRVPPREVRRPADPPRPRRPGFMDLAP